MRISDWSSDVCSSDLHAPCPLDHCSAFRTRDRTPRCSTDFPRGSSGSCDRRDRGARTSFPCSSAGSRSEEHTSELQSLMRTSYAVFCLKQTQQQLTTSLTSRAYTNSHLTPRAH